MYNDDRQYLLRLIRQGEHEQQDFKYKVMDAEKLARSVSAFANTSGGRLLIGVRDDGHISGVRSEEEIFMMHAAAFKWCRPQADIKFETLYAEGKTVVIATVPPSARKPVCALDDEGRPKAYVRIADENIVASPVHLSIWRMEASPKGHRLAFRRRRADHLNDFGRPSRTDAQPPGPSDAHQSPASHRNAGATHPLQSGRDATC